MSVSGLIGVLRAPARKEPHHRAEMTTEWLCGERLELLEREELWFLGRGADGYEAWAPAAALASRSGSSADAWEREAAWSLGLDVEPGAGRRLHVPWGARLLLRPDGAVELPGGEVATPLDAASVVPADERASRFPARGDAVVRTALSWLGVPYVWGGRSDTGADCSGFAQAVFGIHGIRLPRDSAQQADVAPVPDEDASGPSPVEERLASSSAGELLFFAPEGHGITHVAISVGGPTIVHCSATNGSVAVDDLSSDGPLPELLRGSLKRITRPIGAIGDD